MDFNTKDPTFRKLFPDIIEKWKSDQLAKQQQQGDTKEGEKDNKDASSSTGDAIAEEEKRKAGGTSYSDLFVLCVIVLVIAFFGGRLFDIF